MNDRALADLLMELDQELALKTDPRDAAAEILCRVEARVPGSVLRSAATIQLRSLGCSSSDGQ
jgi:hypothetical protein